MSAVLVDDVLAAVDVDTQLTTYTGALESDDSLANAWKRSMLPGAIADLLAELKAAATGEASQEAAVLAAVRTWAGEDVLLSGGVVTDGGAAQSKVNVTAGRLLLTGGVVFSFAAVTDLATLDTKTISVNKTTGVITSNTGVPGGNFSLATCAVSAGVVTPTDTRRQIKVA